MGTSNYYIAMNDINKYAIFHKSGIRITNWIEENTVYNMLAELEKTDNRLKE